MSSCLWCASSALDTTDDTHVHAAEAIANVSSENPPAQEAFFTAGVVLELLHGGDRTRDASAKALAKLLSPVSNRDAQERGRRCYSD